MKALIMAAGRGTRISRHLDGRPKCTVDVGGTPLVERTVRGLLNCGIKQIGIVVGYRGDVIRRILQDYPICYFENPFYDVTNSIASLWFARDFLDDSMIMMNGDVYLERTLMDLVVRTTVSPVLFSDETRTDEADYRLKYVNGRLIAYGKDLPDDETTGEYVGVAHVASHDLDIFRNKLELLIRAQRHGLWWEDILYSLSCEMKISVTDISPLFWGEVDYIEDYLRIQNHVRGGESAKV